MTNTAMAAASATKRSDILSQAVAETAQHLAIGPSELAPILGISQPSASRLLRGEFFIKEGTSEWQLSALFVRLYRGLFSIVGNSDELARNWLTSANRAFGDRHPIDVIKSISGLVLACDYIDSHRAPA